MVTRDSAKGQRFSSSLYFQETVQKGNYFNHDSTDEAVYELSKYFNLLNSILLQERISSDGEFWECFNEVSVLLCHLHLPACSGSSIPTPIPRRICLDVVSNRTRCHRIINDLNNKGANFTWPPVNVNCEDTKWFSNEELFCK
jgi:hypothetical protein